MKVLNVSNNIEYYLNNPNLIEAPEPKANAYRFEVGQKLNKLILIKRCRYRDGSYRSSLAYWICKCECGKFYLIRSSKLKLNPPIGCPICENRSEVKNSDINLIKKYTDLYYGKYFNKYIELEDFIQELLYIIIFNRKNYRNIRYIKPKIMELLKKLKKQYYSNINFSNYNLDETVIKVIPDTMDMTENLYIKEKFNTLYSILKTDNTFLTDMQKDIIISNCFKGESCESISERYNLSYSRINYIKNRIIEILNDFLLQQDKKGWKITDIGQENGHFFKRRK